MDSDDNTVANMFENEELVEHIREHIFAFIDGLTRDDTLINDEQRVRILLDEITTLFKSPDAISYAHRVFGFISDALAVRGNSASCPDIELDRTILLIGSTVKRCPHPPGSGMISFGRLGIALYTRFNKSKNIGDIDESISIFRLICDLNPSLGFPFSNLGAALIKRFQFGLRNKDDLTDAVEVMRMAYKLTPESIPTLRLQCLANLCVSLKLAYKEFSQPEYLEEAIDVQQHIVMTQMEDQEQSPESTSTFSSFISDGNQEEVETPLTSLAELLHLRFKHYGKGEDLEEAIQITLSTLESTLPGDVKSRCASLERLAFYLHSRMECDNNLDDANAVIEIYREVLQLQMSQSNDHQPDCLSNLGMSLNERYKITGDKKCLDEAIYIFREGEAITPTSHTTRSYILHNLADALRERYRAIGAELDLEESVFLLREALHLRPIGHELRPTTLHLLSTCLKLKYEASSFSVYREASALLWGSFDGFPYGYVLGSPHLHSLGAKFRETFQASREKELIDESITCLEEAIALSSSPSDKALVLNSLGNSLRSRSTTHFVELRYFLENLVAMKMKAARIPGKALSALNDQVEFLQQFDSITSYGDLEDINMAMSCYKQVMDLRSFGIIWSFSLMGFAHCLSTRFHYLGDIADLQEAIGIYRSLLKDYGNVTSRNLTNFAQLLMKTFIATKEDLYLEESVTQYRAATKLKTASLLERQTAARIWASAVNGYNHESGLEAYKIAIGLLPQIVSLNMNIDSRRKALQEADAERTCHNGVGYAIQLGRLLDAVEFLEQGRAIYWSQVLQLRSPMEELLETAPELANTLRTISHQLHLGSLRDSLPNDIHDSQQRQSVERDIAYYQDLESEWENVLEKVRGIKGFEEFLLPKKISTIQMSLETDETIVLLSESGMLDTSNALLISCDGIRHVPLPGVEAALISSILSLIKTETNSQEYRGHLPSDFSEEKIFPPTNFPPEIAQAFINKYRYGRPQEYGRPKHTSLHIALHWIWEEVTKPVIQALGIKRSDDPPRVWWCPTGRFSFLPLHAAGVHESSVQLPDQPPECVSDYLISSYIPTLSSFSSRRSGNSPEKDLCSKSEFKMTVILEPRTLPGTVEELQRIKMHVPSQNLTILGDSLRNPASVESVVSCLPTASIVHFSCHGKQNMVDPLESALLMDDGPLTIRHIMQQPMPRSYLAFLCACETATGTEELADEAMSFGSSLLYSGFRSVVGTLWSIADEDGATIADYFYERLFDKQGSQGNTVSLSRKNHSARALHLAVKRLREAGVPLKRWVPFIHMGV